MKSGLTYNKTITDRMISPKTGCCNLDLKILNEQQSVKLYFD